MAEPIEIVCGGCGVIHWMSREYVNLRRKDHKTWYCPNGCPRAYNGPSEEEKLRKALETEKQQNAMYADDARRARERAEAAERSASAYKGVTTRLKKRAANGVCPCCNRTFANLQRHMASKHAGFAATETLEGVNL